MVRGTGQSDVMKGMVMEKYTGITATWKYSHESMEQKASLMAEWVEGDLYSEALCDDSLSLLSTSSRVIIPWHHFVQHSIMHLTES